jgi:hypothetical protein
MWVIHAIGRFIAAHWVVFLLVAIGIAVLVAIELFLVWKNRPKDSAGNGITIGQAKAFDNRSLALRVERLNAGLENLKVINQSVTDNLSTFQQQTTTEDSRSFLLVGKGSKAPPSDDQSEAQGKAATGDAPADFKPVIGLAASDVLNDRLNLASQIFNLQLLYERSLSDRMIGADSRLQTVLGFQVSITPPSGYEDCAAVAEVAVRMAPADGPASLPGVAPLGTPNAVSLVALMPQEKSYNAESISTSERSIEGSAVARVLTMGFSGRRGTRQLFVHRDSDTVAFEREPRAAKDFLEGAIVFGWEFRPVLGRRTVSAGTRQMLAVVAIPVADSDVAGESVLEICTRSYWRSYDRKRQTSVPNWSWWPWKIDRSAPSTSAVYDLQIPNTARIQSTLSPKLSRIHWVNSGDGKAMVVIRGSNFFSGTKVVVGGVVHQEENGTLTLKSDQALEFETTMESLAVGDAVLSCRYGPSFRLAVPSTQRKVDELKISRAMIRPQRKSKAFRLSIDITGWNEDGEPMPFTVADVQALPEPILFVGSEPVPMPYDYGDVMEGTDASSPGPSRVRVEAWVTAKTLAKSTSVSFRVPFCGFEYQTSQPLSFSEPTVVRMGGDGIETVFRIFYPQGFGSGATSALSIDLDQTYVGGDASSPTLARMSDTEYRFKVMTETVSQYQNMVVRIGSGEPYLLPIPPAETPREKPTIDAGAKPPVIKKGERGPFEWSGSGLDAITDVSITQTVAGQAAVPVSQQFTTYADGTRLLVYLSAGSTSAEGKLTLDCTISPQEKLTLQVFVTG